MKATVKFLSGALATLALTPSAQSATPKFWINEAEKTVVVAPNPTLSVKLIKLDVDSENYARVDVGLSYVFRDMTNQIQTLMKDYPGYKTQRVILENDGAYNYQVPLLQISRQVSPLPGSEGPHVEDDLIVTKAQYLKLKSEIDKHHAIVTFTGNNAGSVPTVETLERKEADASICERVLGKEKTFGSMIANISQMNLPTVAPFEYDSTRTALVQDIFENCFELGAGTGARINSFADVLSIGLRSVNPGRKLVGETTKKIYSRQSIPLSYEIKQEGVE